MPLFKGTTGNDSLTGAGGDDVIKGLDGDDTLIGNGGNDTIRGGGGRDFILGGDGNDRIDPGDNGIGSSDFVDTGFGNDIVDLSGQTPFQSYFELGHGSLDGLDGILVLIDGSNNLGLVDKGSAGSTMLIDVVNALANGPDWGGMGVIGTLQDDEFHVDPGDDGWIDIMPGAGSDLIRIADSDGFVRLSYWGVTAGVVANLGLGSVISENAAGGFDFDMILGRVDEFQGSNFDDRIAGSRLDDRFITRQGDDIVNGKAGFDLVRYDRSGVGPVNVDLANGSATGTWGGLAFSDTLKNIEAVRGSRIDNDVLKGDGAANLLDGRGGDDLLQGRSGDDTLLGDAGKDRLYGGNGDDSLDGGDGNDKLYGQAGFDTLMGGAGKDQLFGSDSFDLMEGGDGADKFIFVDGDQAGILDFDAAAGSDVINLRGVTEITSFADLSADHLRDFVSAGGSGVEIHDANGTSIILYDRAIGDLSAADFVF